jgi:hypothetical protein
MAIVRNATRDDKILRRVRRIVMRARDWAPGESGQRQGRVIEADLRRLIGDLDARARHLDHALAVAARSLAATNAYKRCYRLIRK